MITIPLAGYVRGERGNENRIAIEIKLIKKYKRSEKKGMGKKVLGALPLVNICHKLERTYSFI